MLKKMGNCSQYPVIPSSFHYYFGKWTKLNLLSHLCLKVANLHWMEGNQGKSRAALLTLISIFRTLDAEVLMMVSLGFHNKSKTNNYYHLLNIGIVLSTLTILLLYLFNLYSSVI